MTAEQIPYCIVEPLAERVPVVLSIPHCGTEFPKELKSDYVSELARFPDDTDWYVDRLYDFAPEIGITMIHARYSRWVIDLNRDPESKALYDDGRIITELCPTTDFNGRNIYNSQKLEPTEEEKRRRIETYYRPYHEKIDELLEESKTRFGRVVFWDAHSIRRHQSRPRRHPPSRLPATDHRKNIS